MWWHRLVLISLFLSFLAHERKRLSVFGLSWQNSYPVLTLQKQWKCWWGEEKFRIYWSVTYTVCITRLVCIFVMIIHLHPSYLSYWAGRIIAVKDPMRTKSVTGTPEFLSSHFAVDQGVWEGLLLTWCCSPEFALVLLWDRRKSPLSSKGDAFGWLPS